MELRQLECFYMVSKLNNFTKAADQLHISQPAITKAIQCLEQELNVRLFDRCQKQVLLTAEGQVFFLQTERILSSVKEAVTEMSEFQNAHKGLIKIGVPPMIGAYLFPSIIASFKQLYPFVDFMVTEDGSLDVLSKVEKGELDLAIAILPDNKQSLKTVFIKEEEWVLCTHPKSPLTRQHTISWDLLRNEPFILLKPGNYQHNVVVQNCAAYNYSPNIVLTSNHFKTIKGLISSGLGISFLMRMVVEDDPSIATIPLDNPMKCKIGLVWNESRYLSQTSRAFIKIIKEYAKIEQSHLGQPDKPRHKELVPAMGMACNS